MDLRNIWTEESVGAHKAIFSRLHLMQEHCPVMAGKQTRMELYFTETALLSLPGVH